VLERERRENERGEGEEEVNKLRDRLREAGGGQDYGHCFSREVSSRED